MENECYSTRKKRLERRLSPALALLLGLGLLSPAFGQQLSEDPSDAPQTATPSEFSRSFINAAKRVKPAVVHVKVGTRGATGSGVIISPDGYILTNNHVASAANELTVKMADGRELRARRIGLDQAADLALIKIEGQNLPYATLGDSSKLEQGEWVIALGSPFGLEQTMTVGIVSALGRKFNGPYDNFIQTDASINPGNSGGALVNMRGEVIGINTSILTRGGGSEGIGFAIPSNTAKVVKDRLLAKAGVYERPNAGETTASAATAAPRQARSHGYLGVSVQDDQTDDGGAVVADLTDGSPASVAGLRGGDVIIEFNGKSVKSSKELADIIATTPVGRAVRLKYVRDGEEQTASVTLSARPGRPSA